MRAQAPQVPNCTTKLRRRRNARVIHGTRDGVVPLELTKALHDATVDAVDDSEFIVVEGAGHTDPALVSHPAGVEGLDASRRLVEMGSP